MGEAGAIGSPIIQESKAKERREEEERNSSLRRSCIALAGHESLTGRP